MSQQEFMPESQQQKTTQDSENTQASSYSQYRTSDMPKRDHPADYEQTIPQYSYRAQEPQGTGQSQAHSGGAEGAGQTFQHGSQQPLFSALGQARERLRQARRFAREQRRHYRTRYRQQYQHSVPPQLRHRLRQHTGNMPGWLLLLLVCAGFLVVLPLLIKLLLFLFAALIALAFVSVLLIMSIAIIYAVYFKRKWQRSRWWRW